MKSTNPRKEVDEFQFICPAVVQFCHPCRLCLNLTTLQLEILDKEVSSSILLIFFVSYDFFFASSLLDWFQNAIRKHVV